MACALSPWQLDSARTLGPTVLSPKTCLASSYAAGPVQWTAQCPGDHAVGVAQGCPNVLQRGPDLM